MKTFREHIKEEVKIGALSSGGIDIERDAVRDEINGILSAIAAKPCVTPYGSLNKIRKALSYFHIHLPKRVYLEGKHGVEVWEINQFGDKMGFNDQGDWIHHVPAKYHLFFHYHMIGSMYYLEAKIVDEKELEEKISRTERMFAESADAATRLELSKATAPKEKAHTALGDCDCSQGDSPSTKDAVNTSMKSEKKLKEGWAMVGKPYDKFGDRTPKAPKEVKPTKPEKDEDNVYKGSTSKKKVRFTKTVKEEQIDEKAPPGAKYERMVKHIKAGYAKDDGLTKKEKSIAYATAWKAKKKSELDEDVYAMRKMKEKMATKIRHGLGMARETQTVMVKSKNNPASKPHRIPKSKYDPTKYVMV